MNRWLVFCHVVSVIVFLGSTVFLGVAIETMGRSADSPFDRRQRFADLFRAYNPLGIAALGVVVMTGAWLLTPQKESLGNQYFAAVGSNLVTKLGLAFLSIMSATWISFGICHRIVRADQGALPVTNADVSSSLMRLRVAIWTTVAITLATIWVALRTRMPLV